MMGGTNKLTSANSRTDTWCNASKRSKYECKQKTYVPLWASAQKVYLLTDEHKPKGANKKDKLK